MLGFFIGYLNIEKQSKKDIKKYCQNNNIPFITLTQPLKSFRKDDIFVDYCHYTDEGADIVGEFIGKQLIELKVS